MTERLPIDQIKENSRNPRKIDEEKFAKLVQRIKEFPKMLEVRPLVLDENNVVLGGNMRLKALRELGYKDAPYVRASNFSEEEKKQFVVVDNLGFGVWDYDILGADYEIEELESWGFDTKGLGVDLEIGEDEVPEPAKETTTKLGDIFILGKHRIMCGDSTDVNDVEKLMNGAHADVILTDPPYNVDYTGKTGDALKIQNDKKTDDEFRDFLTMAFANANTFLKEGGGILYLACRFGRLQFQVCVPTDRLESATVSHMEQEHDGHGATGLSLET